MVRWLRNIRHLRSFGFRAFFTSLTHPVAREFVPDMEPNRTITMVGFNWTIEQLVASLQLMTRPHQSGRQPYILGNVVTVPRILTIYNRTYSRNFAGKSPHFSHKVIPTKMFLLPLERMHTTDAYYWTEGWSKEHQIPLKQSTHFEDEPSRWQFNHTTCGTG